MKPANVVTFGWRGAGVGAQPLPTGQPSEMLSLDTRQERRTNLTLIGGMD